MVPSCFDSYSGRFYAVFAEKVPENLPAQQPCAKDLRLLHLLRLDLGVL
jgi:hypothetical protein